MLTCAPASRGQLNSKFALHAPGFHLSHSLVSLGHARDRFINHRKSEIRLTEHAAALSQNRTIRRSVEFRFGRKVGVEGFSYSINAVAHSGKNFTGVP